MLKLYLVGLFLLVQIALCSKVQLLDKVVLDKDTEKEKTTWHLTTEAEENLNKFKDRNFQVVAVVGPTRAGKSFTMSAILERFENLGGEIHFGGFIHVNQMGHYTEGMHIALVEYQERIILLIDCEGLNAVTKAMDPKLMVIMSMIAQKLMYMETGAITTHPIENISTMISNRNEACETKDVPLNTLYFVLNLYLAKFERNENFLDEHLMKEDFVEIKCLLDDAFPTQKTFFVGKKMKSAKSIDSYNKDLELIFENTFADIEPFTLKGTKLTVGNFIDYLKTVLNTVNTNEKISFPNVLQATYEQFATNKMCELRKDMSDCTDYHEEEELESRLLKIENNKQDFEKECYCYKNQILDLYRKCLTEFEDCSRKFREDNERIGCEIRCTEVQTRSEKLDNKVKTLQEESGGFWKGTLTGGASGVGGGLAGAGAGALIGGVTGLFSKKEKIEVEETTWQLFEKTIIKYKNGKEESNEVKGKIYTTEKRI